MSAAVLPCTQHNKQLNVPLPLGVPLCESWRGAVVTATDRPSCATNSASGCCMAGGGAAQGAATPTAGGAVPSPIVMRRTASLDALYTNKTSSLSAHHQQLIHDWTKPSALPHSLLIDKNTQVSAWRLVTLKIFDLRLDLRLFIFWKPIICKQADDLLIIFLTIETWLGPLIPTE